MLFHPVEPRGTPLNPAEAMDAPAEATPLNLPKHPSRDLSNNVTV